MFSPPPAGAPQGARWGVANWAAATTMKSEKPTRSLIQSGFTSEKAAAIRTARSHRVAGRNR